jgi:uncharacterized protein YfaS (alpha-2-macroglobulin family)
LFGFEEFQDGGALPWFGQPQIMDDRVIFAAEFVPAGTYVLTYQLVLNHAGSYRVLPARAWQAYFPEVQGHTGGQAFTIMP